MAPISMRQSKPRGLRRASEATQAIADKNASNSRLLTLPPEIRNRIYYLVLGDSTIHIWTPSAGDKCRHTMCTSEDCDDHKLEMPTNASGGIQRERLADHHCLNAMRIPIPFDFLRTCRQVYEEAALLPYATNSFRIHSTALDQLDQQLSSFQKKSIKTMTVLCGRYNVTIRKRIMRKFRGLQKLTVVVFHHANRLAETHDLKNFSGLPLRDISFIELQENIGEMKTFDHDALRTRLIEAGEKEAVLEVARKARRKEREAEAREQQRIWQDEAIEAALHPVFEDDVDISERTERWMKRSEAREATR
ncbi:hypothetical protein PRZ48_003799 [Zasmidium cellare]|uniref:DUF7730 domain-containing protein n=1 Tax=Zasmidium cellare TaxID=395010 RepID=A0ABR0EW32_ZASCE|nr:hypothetical protein PRZ48_003799 [Zasmidium cellare]